MAILLVSPTEPLLLRQLGTISPLPEQMGSDFLFPSRIGLIGLQRKTVSDLISSLQDGRLHEDLAKMSQLPHRMLVIEGHPRWTEMGEMLVAKGRGISLTGWWGLLCSVQANGTWVLQTGSLDETGALLEYLPHWAAKQHHHVVQGRAGPTAPWGTARSRDWALHLLQGFEGVGPEVAGAIYDHFGEVPLSWTVTEKELQAVKGIGKGRARKLVAALSTGKEGKEGKEGEEGEEGKNSGEGENGKVRATTLVKGEANQ